jgi:soluble lytic murein transglycosylase-like protein
MRAGSPERVMALYQRAASAPHTFYGLLATKLLGRDMGADFSEPDFDTLSFAALMRNEAAHRAVALWQIGRTEQVDEELARAFGEIDPDLDAAFAALARHLGAPSLELRAAELLSERNVQLTSLYPIPPYQPKGGYALDRAVVLAFARQESRFQPTALSRVGARGVMQIMPTTAATITHDASLARKNKTRLDDPVYSMTLGQDYLVDLLDRQNGNLFGLAAAYNAGAGNLAKWMSLHEGMNDSLLFIESLPVAETRDYIKRVMVNMWMYRKRLGEPADGLDDAAAGGWPTYTQTARMQSTN